MTTLTQIFEQAYRDLRFVLQDAMDSLKSNTDMAREYMETTHEEKGSTKK
jgi:hypothetical protein